MGDVYMVNGKILSGLPNHAKDIEFDNDGTTLSSTNAEDAIKEVNSNLAHESVSVTINNGDTWGVLLNRLKSAMDASKITVWSRLEISNNQIFVINSRSGQSFIRSAAGTSGPIVSAMTISNSSSYMVAEGNTRTNNTNNAVDGAYVGQSLTLYYK